MAKLALLLATFALFLLLANASIYRATVEIDQENPNQQGRSPRCQQQIQRQQQLSYCQVHLIQEVQGGQQGPWGINVNQQQQFLQQCCQQLQQLEESCRCQGLEQAVKSQLQQGLIQPQQIREHYQEASQIPRRCSIEPRQGCDFSSPSVSY